jgi:hypothetical protein
VAKTLLSWLCSLRSERAPSGEMLPLLEPKDFTSRHAVSLVLKDDPRIVLGIPICSTERVCRVSKHVVLGRKARKAHLTIVPEIVVDQVRVLNQHGVVIPTYRVAMLLNLASPGEPRLDILRARCGRLVRIVVWVARCLRHVQVLI